MLTFALSAALCVEAHTGPTTLEYVKILQDSYGYIESAIVVHGKLFFSRKLPKGGYLITLSDGYYYRNNGKAPRLYAARVPELGTLKKGDDVDLLGRVGPLDVTGPYPLVTVVDAELGPRGACK